MVLQCFTVYSRFSCYSENLAFQSIPIHPTSTDLVVKLEGLGLALVHAQGLSQILTLLIGHLGGLWQPVIFNGCAISDGIDVLFPLDLQKGIHQDLGAFVIHGESKVTDEGVWLDASTPHQCAIPDGHGTLPEFHMNHIRLHLLHKGTQVHLDILLLPQMRNGIVLKLLIKGVQQVVGEHVHADIWLQVLVQVGHLLAAGSTRALHAQHPQ